LGQHILQGNPPIAVTVRRSARARRISLRVSGLDGRVTLTLPAGLPEREGLEFAREKHGWLHKQLSTRVSEVQIRAGVELPIEGRTLTLAHGTGRRAVVNGECLLVPGPRESIGLRTQSWLKTIARERLVTASDKYATQLGKPYNRITLRDTRSRWGSCSSAGGLMYSWRLIMTPPDVLDYVAAHEVAHLQEMNHSTVFWNVVETLCPDFENPRQWLRTNGAALHRFRFDT